MRASGGTDEAEAALLDARSEAVRLGFQPMLWRIDAELSGMGAATGDASRATELRNEARSAIERIADSIDDAGLRSRFLALSDVEAVTSDWS